MSVFVHLIMCLITNKLKFLKGKTRPCAWRPCQVLLCVHMRAGSLGITIQASGEHDQSAADINTFSRIMEQMDRLRRYFVHSSFEVV